MTVLELNAWPTSANPDIPCRQLTKLAEVSRAISWCIPIGSLLFLCDIILIKFGLIVQMQNATSTQFKLNMCLGLTTSVCAGLFEELVFYLLSASFDIIINTHVTFSELCME